MPERGDEFLRIVTDARLAEIAEVGEVLANLGVIDGESLAKLTGRNDLQSLRVPAVEVAEVEAESLNACSRKLRVAGVPVGGGRSVVLAHTRSREKSSPSIVSALGNSVKRVCAELHNVSWGRPITCRPPA